MVAEHAPRPTKLIPHAELNASAKAAITTLIESVTNSDSVILRRVRQDGTKLHLMFEFGAHEYALFYRTNGNGSEELKIDRVSLEEPKIPQRFLMQTGTNPEIRYVADSRHYHFESFANTRQALSEITNLAAALRS